MVWETWILISFAQVTNLSEGQDATDNHWFPLNPNHIDWSGEPIKERKKESATKKERREKAKEQKQCVLSKWVITVTEEECFKLIQMQEESLKRNEFETENEKNYWYCNSSEENQPYSVIICVK